MAQENISWGYDRIAGALANLGYRVSDQTVGNVRERHGMEPAPERSRKTTWQEFLSRHWDMIVAADFFTVEVWTPRGPERLIVPFFMELCTRRVHIAGMAVSPNRLWMSLISRNLTDAIAGSTAPPRPMSIPGCGLRTPPKK